MTEVLKLAPFVCSTRISIEPTTYNYCAINAEFSLRGEETWNFVE